MKLRNHTDVPDETVRAIIRAVRPSGISRMRITVFNSGTEHVRGRAYGSGRVRVWLPRKWRPRICHGGGAYLPIAIGSRAEALVMIMAHELRHVWQGKTGHRRPGMVWGSRGTYSERDADAYALRMLRRYRRGELTL